MNTDTATFRSNLFMPQDNFYSPELNNNRAITLYLPPNYDADSECYPVMYMLDGQNVFGDERAFSRGWGVNIFLDELYYYTGQGCIVVAIDNNGERLDELSPWRRSSRLGGGKGDQFLDFIVNTLKP
jgi:predicted alpha/beta superfamily hydrolase